MTAEWECIRGRVRGVAEMAEQLDSPALLDQYGAEIRDALDRYGLSTADTDELYAVLAGALLVESLLAVGVECNGVPAVLERLVGSTVNGLIASLLPAIPAEAKAARS